MSVGPDSDRIQIVDLLLQRDPSSDGATMGHLFVNGVFFCFTLEDEMRPKRVKVLGATAIPCGRYRVIVNKSQRFGRLLPLVLGVVNFTGIRIHSGNDSQDTAGCILIGLSKSSATPYLLSSRAAMNMLLPRIQRALTQMEDVWLTIEMKPAEAKVLA